MRYSITLALVCLLMNSCNDAGNVADDTLESNETISYCDCNELVFDQSYNNFYLTEPRDGYTGSCEVFYPNGNVSLSKTFNKGKIHGNLIEYYENGDIREKKLFDMNFQTGDHYVYGEDGELVFHAIYKRGKLIETVFPTN